MTEEKDITLREGLERFYEEYQPDLSHKKEGLPDEDRSFFRSHDIAHVLFGCDITLFGEGSVKIWTIFGTTLGFWDHIAAYKQADAYELATHFSFAEVVTNIFKLLFSIPVLIIRAKRMNAPWPWSDFEAYLDTPVSELREKFNIQVL